MRKTLIGIGFVLVAATFLPAASAAGWLVNVEDNLVTGWSLKFGSNVAGGQGDTVDVGLANHQCSDEDDVVDVGVMNREGDAACGGKPGASPECHAEPGYDPLKPLTGPVLPRLLGDPATEPGRARCSDDGDTVDVGVLNEEGSPTPYYGCHPEDPYCRESTTGDEEDGVDAGVANREWQDDEDAVDLGILNCEWSDYDDGIDVGILNYEWLWDGSDTFDVSVLSYEDNDGPDRNGVNVFPGGALGFEPCFAISIAKLPRDHGLLP